MLTIDLDTARRFILGKQGLWPGRRWRGLQGEERAMRAMEYLQLDPLPVVARSQDLALHSRVLDYTPGLWERAVYQKRRFFDASGWLAVRQMDELPDLAWAKSWRVVMGREREGTGLRPAHTANGPRPRRGYRQNAGQPAPVRQRFRSVG